MAEETYYSILGIPEKASTSEIKAAYRDLIKQIHPDTNTQVTPFLRRIAEEKAKEITEAYSVLSNETKRRQYDRLIVDYRRQQVSNSSGAQSSTSNSSAGASSPNQAPRQPSAARNNGSRLGKFFKNHPFLAFMGIAAVITFPIVFLSPDPATSSQASVPNSSVPTASPVLNSEPSVPGSQSIVTSSATAASVNGLYLGSVHNNSAQLSAFFGMRLGQTSAADLRGCILIKPPLYGSGVLNGTRNSSHIRFDVNNIKFDGEISNKANNIDGSYVVFNSNGPNELGNFHLVRNLSQQSSYQCLNGVLNESLKKESVNTLAARPSTESANSKVSSSVAIVISSYATLDKRCAFLPFDNYGRCGYGPETIAELKSGDKLVILSPETRAENGRDIRKVRTEQGWVGWIDASTIRIQNP